jgi:hypothetical protein
MEQTYTIRYNNGKDTIVDMTIEEVHNFINGAMHRNKDVHRIELELNSDYSGIGSPSKTVLRIHPK